MNETVEPQSSPSPQIRPKPPLLQRLLPWLITLACFTYLYTVLDRAAAAQGSGLFSYLTEIFGRVSWWHWLGLMVP